MPSSSRIDLDLAVQRVPGVAKSAVVGDPNMPSLVEVSLKSANEATIWYWFVRHGALDTMCAAGA